MAKLGKRKHLLITKEIERALERGPKPFSSESDADDAKVIVKFFSPYSNWTWYVTSGVKQDNGDWYLYGLVKGFESEIGPFMLSELDAAVGPGGAPAVERDCYFGDHTLGEFK